MKLTWADGGYAGKLVTWATTTLKLTLTIVKRPDNLHTFKVLPRRCVVERTFAWISTHRRSVRDYERLPASHEAIVLWAMIALMTHPRRGRAGRRVPAQWAYRTCRTRSGRPSPAAPIPSAPAASSSTNRPSWNISYSRAVLPSVLVSRPRGSRVPASGWGVPRPGGWLAAAAAGYRIDSPE